MGNGGGSGRPIGRSRSTGYLSNGQPVLHGRPPTAGKPLTIYTGDKPRMVINADGEYVVVEGWRRRNQKLLLMLILAAVVVGGAVVLVTSAARKVEYAVVIDSGSTGTRLYVYSWTRDAGKATLPVVNENRGSGDLDIGNRKMKAKAYRRMETEPGLDKFVKDKEGMREALEPLLKWALHEVPERSRPSTSVFLFATAGLRKLPAEESEWILNEARAIISKTPFEFQPRKAKIISGMDEAVYGWIALNYLTKRLDNGGGLATLGSLDLGGSSLEVTFVPEEVPLEKHGRNVTVNSSKYHLYAHSHKAYGMNDAFDRSVGLLLTSEGPETTAEGLPVLHHPCLHGGYNQSYDFSQKPQPAARRLLQKIEGRVQLVGAPDWDRCQQLVDRVVDASRQCEEAPCALGAHQPKLRGQFYALAGFFVVYHFFGLPTSAPLDKVLELGRAFCSQPWGDVIAAHADERNVDRYCFRAPYVVSLLRGGLGLDDKEVTIGSGDIGWTLGAALYEGGALKSVALPTAQTQKAGHSLGTLYRPDQNGVDLSALFLSSDTLSIIVLVLFLCIGGLGITLQWYRSRGRAFVRKSYLPVWSYQGVMAPSWIQPQSSGEYEKIVPVNSRRQSLSSLEPVPASPPAIPIKAPSQHSSQSRLATRRIASTQELTETVQRGNVSPETQDHGSNHSP